MDAYKTYEILPVEPAPDKMQNHCQEDCRKQIKANKLCLDSNGRPFWPKINMADSNQLTPVKILDFSFQDFQYPYVKLPLWFLR